MHILGAICILAILSISTAEAVQKPVSVYVETIQKSPFYEQLKYITNLRPIREVQVFSYIDGNIEKKFRQNGDFVKKGQSIAAVKNITPGYSFSNHIIKAPISGVLVGFFEEVGSYVKKGPAVLSIMDVSQWRIALPMPQQDLVYLKQKNHRVFVQPQGSDQLVQGRLLRISPYIDPVLGTSVVEFVFDKEKLKDARVGMISEVKIQYNRDDAVAVNEKYLLESRARKKKYVYIVNPDDTAERRYLEVGPVRDGRVKILAGLQVGDRIITQMPSWNLKNGQKVAPQNSEKKEKLP